METVPPTPVEQPVEEPVVDQAETTPEEEPVSETKTVKNFWERLDEVFLQNNELKQRMEELVEQFPDRVPAQGIYTSFLFQPERISISSNDDITPSTASPTAAPLLIPTTNTGHYPSEKFSSFRIRLKRPLRNVKSIQLLSGVIPNAVQSIPDYQTFFFWYKLRSVALANQGAWNFAATYNPGDIVTYLGGTFVCLIKNNNNISPVGPAVGAWKSITLPADTTRPNYYDINTSHLNYLWLAPSSYYPPDFTAAANAQFFNSTFTDYQDLVNALNYIIAQNLLFNNAQNDISFQYNATLNKIIMVPNPANLAAGYYYLPCGYEDPNITAFMTDPTQLIYGLGNAFFASKINFLPQYTLNLRLGFTWNGYYPDPFQSDNPWTDLTLQSVLYWYLRPKDPGYYPQPLPPPAPQFPFIPNWSQNTITFNSYPDLVNTSCIRIYADFALASTQDSLGSSSALNTSQPDGLLSIVPVNTNNLGVGYYQNNFNNPLTKIPENITEIGITMLNDQGQPFYLPNSAVVLLELAVEYK